MGALLKFLIELLIQGDAFSIIINIIKTMRTIFLAVISCFIYRYFVSDFTLSKNLEEVFVFFTSGYFLKPLGIFIATWFLFDATLTLILEILFGILFVNKKKKKAMKLISDFTGLESEKQNEIQIMADEQFKTFISKKMGSKFVSLFYEHMPIVEEKTIERFDAVALLIAQLTIVLLFTHMVNIVGTVCLIAFIVALEYMKGVFLSFQIISTKFFKKPQGI